MPAQQIVNTTLQKHTVSSGFYFIYILTEPRYLGTLILNYINKQIPIIQGLISPVLNNCMGLYERTKGETYETTNGIALARRA